MHRVLTKGTISPARHHRAGPLGRDPQRRHGAWTGRSSCVARVQLTDEEWEFIEPYLPIGEYG
ncbi:hypothetical protein StrepF001_43045, partial [Streptomyces sp. F001]|uniref:hypothetical protein n=1 Tax=Streptomyces sp. F001 TaxID=1510026 RepID=UPI0010D9BC4B